jgi:hypothetical protein
MFSLQLPLIDFTLVPELKDSAIQSDCMFKDIDYQTPNLAPIFASNNEESPDFEAEILRLQAEISEASSELNMLDNFSSDGHFQRYSQRQHWRRND